MVESLGENGIVGVGDVAESCGSLVECRIRIGGERNSMKAARNADWDVDSRVDRPQPLRPTRQFDLGFSHNVLELFGNANTGGNVSLNGVIKRERSRMEDVGRCCAREEVERRNDTLAEKSHVDLR